MDYKAAAKKLYDLSELIRFLRTGLHGRADMMYPNYTTRLEIVNELKNS